MPSKRWAPRGRSGVLGPNEETHLGSRSTIGPQTRSAEADMSASIAFVAMRAALFALECQAFPDYAGSRSERHSWSIPFRLIRLQ